MSDKKNKRRQKKRRFLVLNKDGYYDYSLLAVVVLLTCFGLVMLYSTSAVSYTHLDVYKRQDDILRV